MMKIKMVEGLTRLETLSHDDDLTKLVSVALYFLSKSRVMDDSAKEAAAIVLESLASMILEDCDMELPADLRMSDEDAAARIIDVRTRDNMMAVAIAWYVASTGDVIDGTRSRELADIQKELPAFESMIRALDQTRHLSGTHLMVMKGH